LGELAQDWEAQVIWELDSGRILLVLEVMEPERGLAELVDQDSAELEPGLVEPAQDWGPEAMAEWAPDRPAPEHLRVTVLAPELGLALEARALFRMARALVAARQEPGWVPAGPVVD